MKLIARTWQVQAVGQHADYWTSLALQCTNHKEQWEGLARRLRRQTRNAAHASLVLDYNYTKKL